MEVSGQFHNPAAEMLGRNSPVSTREANFLHLSS